MNRYYELIKEAKRVVEEYLYENGLEDLVQECRNTLHSRRIEPSLNKRASVATVLCVGHVYNGQFMMPSTSDCLHAFRHVRRDLSKGHKLTFEDIFEWRTEYGEGVEIDMVRI